MSSQLTQLLIYSPIAIFLTMMSGVIPLLRQWKEDHLHQFVSFSAGVLLATAFLFLLPDSLKLLDANKVGLFSLISFLFLFILEKFIMLHPCEESHCDYHSMGMAAFCGMMLHTFFDGFALGSTFFIKDLSQFVFFAIMAHKIPSSFALASILKKGKWPTSKIIIFLLIFAMMIPLGAFVSSSILKSLNTTWIGIALALSQGTFLYIATSDFLPEVHRANKTRLMNLTSLLIGIGLMMGISLILGDHH